VFLYVIRFSQEARLPTLLELESRTKHTNAGGLYRARVCNAGRCGIRILDETAATVTKNACACLSLVAIARDELQQSSADGNKATLTMRCFHWIRDINLRVRFIVVWIAVVCTAKLSEFVIIVRRFFSVFITVNVHCQTLQIYTFHLVTSLKYLGRLLTILAKSIGDTETDTNI